MFGLSRRSSSHNLARRASSSRSPLHHGHANEDAAEAAILLNNMDLDGHEEVPLDSGPAPPAAESGHTLVGTSAPLTVETSLSSSIGSSRSPQCHRAHMPSVDITTQSVQPPRVRFSSDLERTNEEDGPIRRSLQEARITSSASSTLANRHNLDAPRHSTSQRRNRGYSLRRTLFARNILNQAGTAEEELEEETSRRGTTSSIPFRSLSSQGHQLGSQREQYVIPPEVDLGSERPSINKEEDRINVAVGHYDDGLSSSSQSDNLKVGRTVSSEPVRFGEICRLQLRSRSLDIRPKVEALKDGFRRHILRNKPIPSSKDGRHIDLDVYRADALIDERTNKAYCDNRIRSSRYSLWSFFPKQFLAQFSKLANAYFLLVAILQMIPGLSTTGTYTTIVPLLIFVGISMGKEGIDDLRRYRLDKEENARIAYVLKPDSAELNSNFRNVGNDDDQPPSTDANDTRYYRPTKWIDIKVGDVIRLDRNQVVPADVVLLHADDPNGIAYIETMALDGETNLKIKQPCVPIARACNGVNGILNSSRKIHFAVEDPNSDLYKFDGNATIDGDKMPLTNGEVILRGSILRNARRAFGMVIYTGEECKIRMNANKNPRIKAPALQAYVNRVVAVIVLFVVVLAGACTIAYKYWSNDTESKSWYLEEADVAYGPVFTSFLI
ncbi:hypothetical protein KEM54_002584, partial [Ascosphaera aggregata]